MARSTKSSVSVSVSGSYHRRSCIKVLNSVCVVCSKSTPNRIKENLFQPLAEPTGSIVSLNSVIFNVLGCFSCFSARRRATRSAGLERGGRGGETCRFEADVFCALLGDARRAGVDGHVKCCGVAAKVVKGGVDDDR